MTIDLAMMFINRGYRMRYGKWPESVYIRRSRLGEPYHPTIVQVDNEYPRALPFITEEMVKGQWTFSKRNIEGESHD